jgi:plasmid maintenance system antidote protein VapI
MKLKRINLGEIIRQKVDELGISQAEFAKSIGIARQNVKKTVFEKASLDTDLVCVISEFLDCNLFDYYKDCNNFDYSTKEAKVNISIELGTEKQDKSFILRFGDNKLRVE